MISFSRFQDGLQAYASVDPVELELKIVFSVLISCDLEDRGSHSSCCCDDFSDRQIHFRPPWFLSVFALFLIAMRGY